MSKQIPFLFFIILIVSAMPLPQAEALGIGPPSFELNLHMDGSNSTTVYLLSDGLEGRLVIGSENLPFRVEPSRINMTKEDNYRPVELTFYGNKTLEPGVYEGKVTFLAMTGGFVAVGIKIRAKINLLEVQEEEPEPDIHILEPDEETGHDIHILEPEQEDIESTFDAAVSPDEAQEMDYTPHIMGGAAIVALVLILWWKRR